MSKRLADRDPSVAQLEPPKRPKRLKPAPANGDNATPSPTETKAGRTNRPATVLAGEATEGPSTPSTWSGSDTEHNAAPPAPADNHGPANMRLGFELGDHVPDAVLERLLPFINKSDETNHRYGLATIPPHATWGSSRKTDKFLCVDDKPITVWCVGEHHTDWFQDPQGEPHRRVNIGYRPTNEREGDALRRLYERARPKKEFGDDLVFSSRRMSHFEKGQTNPTVTPFTNIFDARVRYKAKSQMPVLPPSAIGKRDLLLVESYFTRWDSSKDKRSRGKWSLWDVGFELQAVSLLFEAPPGLDTEVTVDIPDINDDM